MNKQSDGYQCIYVMTTLLIFKDNSVKVFINQEWIDIIPLVKLYYNRKNATDKLLEQFEKDLVDSINNF